MRILVFIILLLAAYQAFSPYIGGSGRPVTQDELDTFSVQARMVDEKAVMQSVTASGKPGVLMMYASWCKYCNMLMPGIRELWQEGAFADTNLVFLSIDHELSKLSKYLLSKGYDDMTGAPIILNVSAAPLLKSVLEARGARIAQGVPYLVFIDRQGRVVDEISGFVSRGTVRESLDKIK